MIELQGKYNKAKIFTDVVDAKSIAQVMELLNQEFASGSTIRMMPDIHAGAGCTIGTTMTITDKIVPNLVGVDIGCGVSCTAIGNLDKLNLNFADVDYAFHNLIPSGQNVNAEESSEVNLEELRCFKELHKLSWLKRSLPSLGGGNHFGEMSVGRDGTVYLLIHTGSRNLGKQIAEIYQESAYKALTDLSAERNELIASLKVEGREKEIPEQLSKLPSKKINKQLAYVEGDLLRDYLHDMKFAQRFAKNNRMAISNRITQHLLKKGYKLDIRDVCDTIHNYIDHDAMILRKGAVSAQKGETLIIPLNMRDGSLLCVGRGNSDWNYSAPHGAGRILSRSKAKDILSVTEFETQMDGIYTTCVGQGTLDESPMAYKDMQSIINNIGDTVDIIEVIKPIYNFKSNS